MPSASLLAALLRACRCSLAAAAWRLAAGCDAAGRGFFFCAGPPCAACRPAAEIYNSQPGGRPKGVFDPEPGGQQPLRRPAGPPTLIIIIQGSLTTLA